MPLYVEELDSEFVRLPVETNCSADIWLVSHKETNRAARIRAVIGLLISTFEQDRSRWFSKRARPVRPAFPADTRQSV
ncbi:MAG: hypothetical protein EXQ85_04345 [Alphaproteobacteria bacterium]|nr:hypothetical protein [Alphaproteobacteria bacterium]